jgi:hypothetical protein
MKTLNLTQEHLKLLEMFNPFGRKSDMERLKPVLLKLFREQRRKETERLYAEGVITDESVEAMMYHHERTPYRR